MPEAAPDLTPISTDRWSGLPANLLDVVLLAAGPHALARATAAGRLWAAPAQSDALWQRLASLLWPASTLPPLVDAGYTCRRDLVVDRNRRAAWRCWRPEAQKSAWTWRYNHPSRFYCGRATLLALDEAANELCVYIHALSNYPDLRPASESCLWELTPDNWRRFSESQQEVHHVTEARQLRPASWVPHRSSVFEEKGVLRFPLEQFAADRVYAFSYSCGGSFRSDYYLAPLLDTARPPAVEAGSRGGAVRHGEAEAQGPKACLFAHCGGDGPPEYVPAGHVDHPERDAMRFFEVARLLMETFVDVPSERDWMAMQMAAGVLLVG